MRRVLVALACVACAAPNALSQAPPARPAAGPDSLTHGPRGPLVKTEYDDLTDSTTRSLSAYAIVDTSLTRPDTLAVELLQRWKGRGAVAPVAAVELGLGRTRVEGLPASRTLMRTASGRPAVVFVLDGGRRIRLEQSEYASNGGAAMTFETARYRLSAGDLRLIAESKELRVRVGDRDLWIDPAWRRVAADMVAGQAPR
jgi:hypothetical protein